MRLAGFGAYVPGFRLPVAAIEAALDSFEAPGIQTVAIPNSDEDAIAVVWEVGTRALNAADILTTELGVFLASRTLPKQNESQVPTRYGTQCIRGRRGPRIHGKYSGSD